jgi:alpha-maltose-1-phosphate synthase
MRVVQSTWGKFHSFDLARQLARRGMLEAIFTTYPWFKLKNEGLAKEKVHCRWLLHSFWLGLSRYHLGLGSLEKWWLRTMVDDYTRCLVKNLPPCDVLIALSGSGLAAGRLIQQRGGKYICDRGSTHIRFGDNIVREEFERWGSEYAGTDPRLIEVEEKEYIAADFVTVPSRFAARSFVEMGIPAAKLRCIPYGVDLSRFKKDGDPPNNQFQVLFVGQVSFRKGVPYLLEAFQKLRYPQKKLTLIGAMRPEMKRWLAGKSFENVEFFGSLPQADLSRHMSISHVLVLPSIEEGLALVQGQALACGCPLISSTNTGGEDFFTNGREGFIVPIRDPKAITDRLEELVQNPDLRQRMSEAALRRVVNLGGWDDYGSRMETIIRELVEGSAAD